MGDLSTYSSTVSSADEGILAVILAFIGTYLLVLLAIAAIMTIASWKIYTKAGKPGWASLIPIYSQYVLFEMVGMKGWYILLGFIPVVGGIILSVLAIMANIKLAACFEKDTGFAVGLILLPIVFMPILGFGASTYTPPAN